MSFTFKWPSFSDDFYAKASEILVQGLNRGPMPPIIADKIEVEELNMGTIPPELRILSIGDIALDRFRGIFQLNYTGDAHIVLKTKVQANPLNHPRPPTVDLPSVPSILFASTPLTVPMYLRLSSLRISATIVLVVSKQKGITMVFKNDPLQSVEVSSTFDNIQVMKGFIQREIEGQLRELFRGDLPELIHKLSRNWIQSEIAAGKTVPAETVPVEKDELAAPQPMLHPRGSHAKVSRPTLESARSTSVPSVRDDHVSQSVSPSYQKSSVESPFVPSFRLASAETPEYQASEMSVPEQIAKYDPTYGLRPEGLPTHGRFEAYKKLWQKSRRGLGSVLKEEDDAEEGIDHRQEGSSWKGKEDPFDIIGLEDLVVDESDHIGLDFSSTRSLPQASERDYYTYFDTVPAVGGGVITKPRIIHRSSHTAHSTTSISTSSLYWNSPEHRPGQSLPGLDLYTRSTPYQAKSALFFSESDLRSRTSSTIGTSQPYLPHSRPSYRGTPLSYSAHPLNGPRLRRPSEHSQLAPEDEITLNPQKSEVCAQLTTLARSNQTLSPFTRGFETISLSSSAPSIISPSLAGLNYGEAHIVGRTSIGAKLDPDPSHPARLSANMSTKRVQLSKDNMKSAMG
ncbi:hypothetical protein BT69DRAFT_1356348 [Atractiella rhizophila]|nr:hypothetical protein BT69DRAFT_1356348 [Atractiella rhizophila]